jgi:hypothetical protein
MIGLQLTLLFWTISSSTALAFDLDWNDLDLDHFWCEGDQFERVMLALAGGIAGLVIY